MRRSGSWREGEPPIRSRHLSPRSHLLPSGHPSDRGRACGAPARESHRRDTGSGVRKRSLPSARTPRTRPNVPGFSHAGSAQNPRLRLPCGSSSHRESRKEGSEDETDGQPARARPPVGRTVRTPFAGIDSPAWQRLHAHHTGGGFRNRHEWRTLLIQKTSPVHENLSSSGYAARCRTTATPRWASHNRESIPARRRRTGLFGRESYWHGSRKVRRSRWYSGLLVGLEAGRRPGTGSSLDGKGEEGIDRSFEGATVPEYLGEQKSAFERGEQSDGEVVRVDVGLQLPIGTKGSSRR